MFIFEDQWLLALFSHFICLKKKKKKKNFSSIILCCASVARGWGQELDLTQTVVIAN
jgi:hypothetical protein